MSATAQLTGRVVRGPMPADDLWLQDRVLLTVAVDGLATGHQPPVEWVQVLAAAEPPILDLMIGDVVQVSGRLRLSRWIRLDGARRQSLKVVADQITVAHRCNGPEPGELQGVTT